MYPAGSKTLYHTSNPLSIDFTDTGLFPQLKLSFAFYKLWLCSMSLLVK